MSHDYGGEGRGLDAFKLFCEANRGKLSHPGHSVPDRGYVELGSDWWLGKDGNLEGFEALECRLNPGDPKLETVLTMGQSVRGSKSTISIETSVAHHDHRVNVANFADEAIYDRDANLLRMLRNDTEVGVIRRLGRGYGVEITGI